MIILLFAYHFKVIVSSDSDESEAFSSKQKLIERDFDGSSVLPSQVETVFQQKANDTTSLLSSSSSFAFSSLLPSEIFSDPIFCNLLSSFNHPAQLFLVQALQRKPMNRGPPEIIDLTDE